MVHSRAQVLGAEEFIKGATMIEKSVSVGNRPVGAVEATSAVDRSKTTRENDRQQSVDDRERKDTAKVSAEGRALLEAEQKERSDSK